MPNDPRRPQERDMNTLGGGIGVYGVGENTEGGCMALCADNPHTARERPCWAPCRRIQIHRTWGWDIRHRRPGSTGIWVKYSTNIGMDSSFRQRDAGIIYYGGGAQGGYGHLLGIGHTNA